MPDIGDDLWPAERRLLEAVRSGQPCDLTGGESVSAEQMTSWGSNRTVRGPLLRQLLIVPASAGLVPASTLVDLRGAVVDTLDLTDAIVVVPVSLNSCRIIGLRPSGATFTGDAGFDGATFTGDAGFYGATFTGDAGFTGNAGFAGATFTGNAGFAGATFTG